MPFPSRGKNNVRDFSSASSFSAFRELPFKLPRLLRLLKKNVRLMRERERLLFDESATFTRVCDGCANDCQMRHFCDQIGNSLERKERKVLSLNKNDLSQRRRVPPLGVDDFSLGNWR